MRSEKSLGTYDHEFLTHWGLQKMVAISQTTFSGAFLKWKCMNFVPDGPLNSIPALVQILAAEGCEQKVWRVFLISYDF